MAVIALDLGGTKLASAIVSPGGRLSCRQVAALEGRGGKAVGTLVCEHLHKLLADATKARTTIAAIGIAVPGIATPTGEVWAPNIHGWSRYPLHKEIATLLKSASSGATQHASISIQSDRSCYILGEAWRGAARGARHGIFIAVGTGIGAGILTDGHVLHGADDIAGAVGWMALDRPFRKKYAAAGCFEYYGSGSGLAARAAECVPGWSPEDLFSAAAKQHSGARKIVAEAIECWGMAVANLVSLFNPEMVVFGGGIFGPARKYLPQIAAEARKWAQPVAMRNVRVVASKLGADTGLLGAARAALDRISAS